MNAVGFVARFWSKVDVRGPDECWPWLGAQSKKYGHFFVRGDQSGDRREGVIVNAHVVAYELSHAVPVPEGFDVDHTCRNQVCQNPRHLRTLPRSDHGRKSALARWAAVKEVSRDGERGEGDPSVRRRSARPGG